MKTIVIYSYCQGRGIQVLLEQFFKIFSEEVQIFLFENYLVLISGFIDSQVLAEADIFIYQPISAKYEKQSSDYILSLLKPSCIRISFPYVYNDAFWIFVHEGRDFKGRESIDKLRQTKTKWQINCRSLESICRG